MAREPSNRNEDAGEKPGLKTRALDWVERHPRTGWYIAAMATINVVLNLLDLFQ